MDSLGIDVSKADFHACLIQGVRRSTKSFANNPSGYRQLRSWLKNRSAREVHACMEATGGLWLNLARSLYESAVAVSVVNPCRTALYARSQLRRTKTDQVDAAMIADFCRTQQPDLWRPPAPEILELRAILSYREHLVSEKVRLKQVASEFAVGKALQRLHRKQLTTLEQSIKACEQQLRDLVKANSSFTQSVSALTAIAGVGLLTALECITQLPVDRLRDEKAAAAYVGLSPRERQSGTSVLGRTRICKTGNSRLRKALFMPAATAIRHNTILRAFAERLKTRGKPAKVILVAVMRKLVVIAYRILKGIMPMPVAVQP